MNSDETNRIRNQLVTSPSSAEMAAALAVAFELADVSSHATDLESAMAPNLRDQLHSIRHAIGVRRFHEAGLWADLHTLTAELASKESYQPVNLTDSVDAMGHEVIRLTRLVQDLQRDVKDLRSQLAPLNEIRAMLSEIHGQVAETATSGSDWSALAEPSFAFWNNDEDSIYDEL